MKGEMENQEIASKSNDFQLHEKKHSLSDDEWGDSQDDFLVKALEESESGVYQRPDESGDTKISPEKFTTPGDEIPGTSAGLLHPALSDCIPVPLEAFRPGYLWVSDFSSQAWCEQKLHYTYTAPALVEETPAMAQGSTLHLARELAAHDKVDVQVTSNEDIWAIKVINLLTSVQGFLNGQTLAREVPVFGAPFEQDIFIVGLIDELRFDLNQYTVDLSDLKTRTSRYLPSRSQEAQHCLQVMLYKKLFDDLVQGNATKDLIAKHLRVRLDAEFGEGIGTHLQDAGIECNTLNDLLDFTYSRLQACTCVNKLSVEYVFQDTGETLGRKEILYDEANLRQKFVDSLDYWRGQRPPKGVEIEEAWKCHRCEFVDICEWRQKKTEECVKKNCKNAYV